MRITGTKQWAPCNANCILGCSNDCEYCYAKKMAIRFGRATRENWHEMRYNSNCKSQIRKYNGKIMFPTSHDLHIEHIDWWMPFLKGLLEKGNEVLIVTKPQFAAVHAICRQIYKYADQMEFRFTIGTDDEETRRFWEPNAPEIHERIQSLQFAYETGYKTSLSMEPLLTRAPGLLINQVYPFVTGDIWIGMMNHMSINDFADRNTCWFYEMKSINSIENIKRIYDLYKDNPKIKWKDSIQDLLGLNERTMLAGA